MAINNFYAAIVYFFAIRGYNIRMNWILLYRGPLKIELSSNNNNLAIESETGQCHDFSNDAMNKVAMFHAVKY